MTGHHEYSWALSKRGNVVSEIRNNLVLHFGSLLSVCLSFCSLSVSTISGSRAFPPRLAPCVERLSVTTSGTVGLRPHRVVVAAYYALPAIPRRFPSQKTENACCWLPFIMMSKRGGGGLSVVVGNLSTVSIMIPDQLHVDAVARDFSTSRSTL